MLGSWGSRSADTGGSDQPPGLRAGDRCPQPPRELVRGRGALVRLLRQAGEDQLRQALARHYGIGLIDLDEVVLDRALAGEIDPDYAWRHRLVPVHRGGDCLTIAMDDPGDRWVIADLERITGCYIRVVTARSAALRRGFSRIYRDRAATTGDALEARHVETRRVLAAIGTTSRQIRRGSPPTR